MLLCRECFLGISVSHAWNHRSLSLLTAVILREGEYHKWDNCNYLERFLTLGAVLVSFQKYLCLPDKMTVILCPKHKNNLVSFFSTRAQNTYVYTGSFLWRSLLSFSFLSAEFTLDQKLGLVLFHAATLLRLILGSPGGRRQTGYFSGMQGWQLFLLKGLSIKSNKFSTVDKTRTKLM